MNDKPPTRVMVDRIEWQPDNPPDNWRDPAQLEACELLSYQPDFSAPGRYRGAARVVKQPWMDARPDLYPVQEDGSVQVRESFLGEADRIRLNWWCKRHCSHLQGYGPYVVQKER